MNVSVIVLRYVRLRDLLKTVDHKLLGFKGLTVTLNCKNNNTSSVLFLFCVVFCCACTYLMSVKVFYSYTTWLLFCIWLTVCRTFNIWLQCSYAPSSFFHNLLNETLRWLIARASNIRITSYNIYIQSDIFVIHVILSENNKWYGIHFVLAFKSAEISIQDTQLCFLLVFF